MADGAKILVVDDAPQNVKLLRVILKDAGYRVAEAASGPEALEALKLEKPDAMVLDVRMPGMTGFEVCEAVRRDPQFAAMPVIMLTALSQPEERIRGIEAGATDFISKPFNKQELLARIRTSLALAGPLTAAVAQLPGSVVVAAPDWKLAAASPAALALLEIDPQAALGLDVLELLKSRGAALPEQADDAWTTRMASGIGVSHTPVRDPAGGVALRVFVLEC